MDFQSVVFAFWLKSGPNFVLEKKVLIATKNIIDQQFILHVISLTLGFIVWNIWCANI